MPWWWLQARGCELSAIGTANEVKGEVRAEGVESSSARN